MLRKQDAKKLRNIVVSYYLLYVTSGVDGFVRMENNSMRNYLITIFAGMSVVSCVLSVLAVIEVRMFSMTNLQHSLSLRTPIQ